VVIICPKCKTKLKVDENKIKPEGTRFKCPKCEASLIVKKPKKEILAGKVDTKKILVAHSNPNIINEITSLLKDKGFEILVAKDGIEAMVKTLKEQPFLALIEVSLPKILGFEVCRRLRAREETRNVKFILITSLYDKTRYIREPESLHDADDYIDEHKISESLLEKIQTLSSKQRLEEKVSDAKIKEQPVEKKPTETKIEKKVEEKKEIPISTTEIKDEGIERAKRLARTIISDIYLYNTAKADKSILNNTFYTDFAPEIKEGLKLYESRIPAEIRSKGDFFREAINDFIEKKRKLL